MALKFFKPTSPGVRGKIMVSRKHLHQGRPVKSLTTTLRRSGGRNHSGKLVNRRKGGGVRRRYRILDFKFSCLENGASVKRLEYDPNRSA